MNFLKAVKTLKTGSIKLLKIRVFFVSTIGLLVSQIGTQQISNSLGFTVSLKTGEVKR